MQWRLEAIKLLRTGEYVYADVIVRGLLVKYMPEMVREEVIRRLDAVDFIRVADIIEYEWNRVVMPKVCEVVEEPETGSEVALSTASNQFKSDPRND